MSAMQAAGIPVDASDAHPVIKKMAKIILSRAGGEGVVRELADIILKAGK
jgi:3-deoxy-D-manno-octulosonate 8-phosphate phosphatase KdsC-like HAD superfamily phosphatase